MIGIFKLNDSIRNLPIEGFHLPISIYNKLKAEGISTLEQMLSALRNSAELLNRAQKEKTRAILSIFHHSLDGGGKPDWTAFCEKAGITLLPQKSAATTDAEILAGLSGTIQEILTFGDSDEKKWITIQYRFGLNGKSLMTLDEIGQGFGKITREAVRLIERKSLMELRDAFLEGSFAGKRYRVDESVSGLVCNLKEIVESSGLDYATESELFALIGSFVGLPVQRREEPLLCLLFTLFDFSQIRELPEALPNVWQVNAEYSEAKLKKALTLVATTLTGDYLPPIDEFELLAKVNRKMRSDQAISAPGLARILGLCDFVETTDEGKIQAKFHHIGTRAGQAERLLVEAGKPISINELVREMNRRLHAAGRRKLEVLNVANVMSADQRFMAVGGIGLRGLARWQNVEVRSIVDVMLDALVSFNRPASVAEVFTYVNERRPASLNSVKIYLDAQEMFLRTGPKEWGLATWAEARRLNVEFEKTRRRNAPRQRKTKTKFERSVSTVREYLEQTPTHEAPLSILVAELFSKLDVPDQSAYQYISRMEFVEKTKTGPNNVICKLVDK